MAAITAAEKGLSSVYVLEASSKPLEKVRLSGGGRCNVTHACWNPRDLIVNYPRGKMPLLGPFNRFATRDAVSWFAARGVDLKVEADGRMFPVTNSSESVVNSLRESAIAAGVKLFTKALVEKIELLNKKQFFVQLKDQRSFISNSVLIATGGHPSGRRIAETFGHSIIRSVPSLFTLSIESDWIKSNSGIALDDVQLSLITTQKTYKETGRVLLTHWGLSGPAVLKLTSFAARQLYYDNYKAEIIVNWICVSDEEANSLFNFQRNSNPRKTLGALPLCSKLPRRLWLGLLYQAGIDPDTRWSEFSKKLQKQLLTNLVNSHYKTINKGPYGEEFVTAGGVELNEIDFVTMESRLQKGLYFSGEVLDIDGVTGGFNFQHCWTSGWLAGLAIADSSH